MKKILKLLVAHTIFLPIHFLAICLFMLFLPVMIIDWALWVIRGEPEDDLPVLLTIPAFAAHNIKRKSSGNKNKSRRSGG